MLTLMLTDVNILVYYLYFVSRKMTYKCKCKETWTLLKVFMRHAEKEYEDMKDFQGVWQLKKHLLDACNYMQSDQATTKGSQEKSFKRG